MPNPSTAPAMPSHGTIETAPAPGSRLFPGHLALARLCRAAAALDAARALAATAQASDAPAALALRELAEKEAADARAAADALAP